MKDVYSNFDHSLDEEAVKELKDNPGMRAAHPAGEFFGIIEYNNEKKTFIETVMKYRSVVGTYENENIVELINEVNSKYGYD